MNWGDARQARPKIRLLPELKLVEQKIAEKKLLPEMLKTNVEIFEIYLAEPRRALERRIMRTTMRVACEVAAKVR